MNIEIKNFGPIEYLKIDLEKDIHLIYGKNAIGKSYAIYCVYCLLKNLKDKELSSAYYRRYLRSSETGKILNSFEDIFDVKDSKEKRTKLNDLTSTFIDFFKKDFQGRVLGDFQNSLLNTFSSLDNLTNRYNNQKFEVIINLQESEVCKKIKIFKGKKGNLDAEFEFKFSKLEFVEKATKRTKYSVYQDGKYLFGKPTEQERNSELIRHFLLFMQDVYSELSAGMREIYFLPASRSGLYQGLNSFAPIIAGLTQNRFFISNKKIELPTLSEPVSDYYIDLSTIDRKHFNKEFDSLIKTLEGNVLNGTVEFDDETKNITYEPKGLNIKLNLSEASSMVAEMSPLVLYLKHIINHKFQSQGAFTFLFHEKRKKASDVLFIEEPEAHLHPEVQVELIKIFAEFIKHNLKVFITSHSNYMFQELNNLILDKKIDAKKIAVYHLIQTKDGSTQNAEMIVTEEGIDDENFQETSIKLYEERMRILEEAEK